MKQTTLFNDFDLKDDNESKYASGVEAPVYEPKNKKPDIRELCDKLKSNKLIREINESNLLQEEKDFLIYAAYRHHVFNYEKIADYYAHASKEMQELMERSALVIIDFDKAIELGFVKVCEEIKNKYLEENAN